MDYYEKDREYKKDKEYKEYKKDKGHKKSGFWHILGAFVLGGILLLSLLFFFNRPVAPAFGYVYQDNTTTTTLVGGTIDFDFAGPLLNTEPVFNSPDAAQPPEGITVETSGVYEINANIPLVPPTDATPVVFDIVVIDEDDIITAIPGSIFVGSVDNTAGTTIKAQLDAGETVTVRVRDGGPATYLSAKLTVERVGPLVDTE
ncbi:hypothetical protein [Bacillus thermotolerans]|uniref:Uncharacterized protein n=1 Tax=Bacillus thermotolerans TaxID=1221996 RepID=A0A0F5HS98_BACTR|nr:hypothetical protein [Bacillus thermotolerans]KKB33209.1 hypothetical protein QY97_03640 [Bacillus thermotolerans]KKB35910.1 hypothetical protein QY95_03274 [Bacillus thermotolerans]